MIAVEQLQYVRLGTADLDAAADFAQRVIGLQLVDRTDDQARFRSDHRHSTLIYARGDPADQAIGFEVRDPDSLDRAIPLLQARELDAVRGGPDAAARRDVRDCLTFAGPGGVTIELVVRPLFSGWRYVPPRDAGIRGLAAVAIRSPAAAADQALWTELFDGQVSDWVGDAAYIRLDAAHHRLAIHPADRPGILAIEFEVESVDQIMQASYFLPSTQVTLLHGPGRRPTSEQMFLSFAGPDGIGFSYVTESRTPPPRPRQFAKAAASFCAWGSQSELPEFNS